MEISEMEYNFLVKSMLGQSVDLISKKNNKTDSIIKACIARADRDMITAGCNYLVADKNY